MLISKLVETKNHFLDCCPLGSIGGNMKFDAEAFEPLYFDDGAKYRKKSFHKALRFHIYA